MSRRNTLFVVIVGLVCLAGCKKADQPAAVSSDGPPAPPPHVGNVGSGTMAMGLAPGHDAAADDARVGARMNGKKVH